MSIDMSFEKVSSGLDTFSNSQGMHKKKKNYIVFAQSVSPTNWKLLLRCFVDTS